MKQTKRDLVSIKVSRDAYLVIDKEQSDAKQNRVKSATQDEIVDRWLAAFKAVDVPSGEKQTTVVPSVHSKPDPVLLTSIHTTILKLSEILELLSGVEETLSTGADYEETLLSRSRETRRLVREFIDGIRSGKGAA